MRIDRKLLVERLISRTGLDAAEAEEQLDRMVGELERQLQQREPAEISSFGTLEREGDEVSFSPSPVLEMELNRKYAGMEPIELIGAFRRRAVAADEAHEGHVVEADQPEPSPPEWTESPDPEELLPERDKILVRETVAKMVGGGKPSDDSGDEPSGNAGDPVDGKGMQEEPLRKTEEDGEAAGRAEKRAGKAPAGHRSDPIGSFVTTAVIILLVLVGGWFAYDYGFDQTDGAAEPAAVSGESTVETDPPAPQTNGNEDAGPETESAGGDGGNAGDERWGLTGPATAAGGYTIVVYSLNTEEVAREVEDTLLERGYRVIVRQATVEGARFWRVGLGQFESVPDAQQAVEELPEPYRTNHFIRRINN